MRNVIYSVVMALAILLLCLCMAYAIIDTQEQTQLRNAYYPFTVETSIRDR